MGLGRPGGPPDLDGGGCLAFPAGRHAARGPVLLRHHRDQLSLPGFLRRGAAGRAVFAVVSLALLWDAALQREPGGVSAPAQVPLVPLDGHLEGVQPRHGAIDLADRPGDLWLAAAARPAGRGLDRGMPLRPGRVHLGPPGSYQHDQRPGQRAVCDLGAGMVVGTRPVARGGSGGARPGLRGLRGALAGRVADLGNRRSLRPLQVCHRAGRAGAVA